MHLEVLQENLKKNLSFLQKVTPTKPQMTVLSSLLMKLSGSELCISATDLYLGIKTKLVVKGEVDGELLIEGETFRSFINSLDKGTLELTQKDDSLLISQGKTKGTFSVQKSEEFPEFPEVLGSEFTLNAEDLDKIQTLVAFAAGIDQTRPVLTAVLMSFKKQGLEVVATDGFRLSKLTFPSIISDQESQVLVPAKALGELSRIAKQLEAKEITMKVATELKQILFEIDSVQMYVRLIDGDYPPYEKIIPPDFLLQAEFDAQDFLTQLKRAAVFAKGVSNVVSMEIEADEMTIKSSSPASGDYVGSININNEGKNSGIIAFNVAYLIDFINAVKPEFLVFRMNESLKPAMFIDKSKSDFFYIAMPFRLNT